MSLLMNHYLIVISMQYVCLDEKRNPVTPCSPKGQCRATGDYLRDVVNCNQFYQCFEGLEKLGKFQCDTGLQFNMVTKMCDWPRNVDCAI